MVNYYNFFPENNDSLPCYKIKNKFFASKASLRAERE